MPRDNLYETLGIPKSASLEDVRKAYKGLAVQLHPDKNPSQDSHEQFTRLKRAYDILSDPDKRALYDQHGMEEVEDYEQAPPSTCPCGGCQGGVPDFILIELLRQHMMEERLFGGGRHFFTFTRGGPRYPSPPRRQSYHKPQPKASFPKPKQPLEKKTVDVRSGVPEGSFKHIKVFLSNKTTRLEKFSYDEIQPRQSEKPVQGEKMVFGQTMEYVVEGDPGLSFTCSQGGAVFYQVKVPVKKAQKQSRVLELPLPNGNILVVTMVGVLHPNVTHKKWTFDGEGLRGGNLEVTFLIQYPQESQPSKKKKNKKKGKHQF